MIDLHCHSSASDGAVAPENLPALAQSLNVEALALTDHDTTAGLDAFMNAGAAPGFQAIPGIELSTSMDNADSYHIVGLFLRDWAGNRPLQEALMQIRRWREERNLAVLARLCELGKPVTLEEALACGEEGCVLGRPHIAAAMLRKGYCRTLQEAFNTWLGRGKPAYVQRQVLPVEQAIRCLHGAGAVAVWAHPYSRHNLTNSKMQDIIGSMKAAGLDAIEAYYPEHTPTETRKVLELAASEGLLVSGGCDFHGGPSQTSILIGRGHGGGFRIPPQLLPPIQQRAREIAGSI